jgi:spermidine synthase
MNASAKRLLFLFAFAWGATCLCALFIWIRWLILLFGDTPSTTITIAAALAGAFAAGVWIASHVADQQTKSGMTGCARLGIATGVYGFASAWIFRGMEASYSAGAPILADHAGGLMTLRLLLVMLLIGPPVIAMAGSLPLLARGLTADTGGLSYAMRAGYGASTIGAAAGIVTMIYGLLPSMGFSSMLFIAAGIQIGVSLGIWAKEARLRRKAGAVTPAAPTRSDAGCSSVSVRDWRIAIGVAATGFAVTAFDICVARVLGMVFGSSIYTYGAYWAVVFAGIGVGSMVQANTGEQIAKRKVQITELECLVAFSLAISVLVLSRVPFLFAHFFPVLRVSFGRQTAAVFCACAAVGFLPALFLGAVLAQGTDNFYCAAAGLVRGNSTVCPLDVIGIAAGACVAEVLLIPRIGLHLTAVAATIVPLAAVVMSVRIQRRRLFRILTVAGTAIALVIVGGLARWPVDALSDARNLDAELGADQPIPKPFVKRLLYYRDGFRSTIAVRTSGGLIYLQTNGKTEASNSPVDMAGQLLLGHLPMLLHPAAREVLILGLGSGVTAAAVSHYAVQRIDLVEQEPAAVQAARFFEPSSGKVLENPVVHLMIGSSRDRLLTSRRKYDVIICNCSNRWGEAIDSAATLEFYRIAASRLKSGGVFAQRVPVEGLTPDDLDRLAATFHRVFPHMEMWTSSPDNLMFLGTRDGAAWDYSRLQQQFRHTRGVSDELNSIGIWQPFALFGAEVLGKNESDAFTRDAEELNTDDRPVVAFNTGRTLYEDTRSSIAREINPFRRPEAHAIAGFDPQHDLDADGTYLLGFAYASMGQTDLGIRYMEKSTAMAPDRPMFFVGLGNQYRAMGRTTEARMAYERALSLDLNNVDALVSLGEIRLAEGQLEWTRVLSERALRLAPQDSRVHALMDRLQEMEH